MIELNYFCVMQLRYYGKQQRKKGWQAEERKKRKPIYEIEGFVLTIPQDVIDNMLRDMSKPIPKNNDYTILTVYMFEMLNLYNIFAL